MILRFQFLLMLSEKTVFLTTRLIRRELFVARVVACRPPQNVRNSKTETLSLRASIILAIIVLSYIYISIIQTMYT